MARYDPCCAVCHARPKMDRCDCCEECWYSGQMTPRQRRLAAALREPDPYLFAGHLPRPR